MGKILQGSNPTITSWARSSRGALEDLAHDVMVGMLPWRILPIV
jgi:hypothetical protein